MENVDGEIENPLKGIPRQQLLDRAEKFVHEKGLPEDILPLIQKGALIAQDPAGFESVDMLSDEEKHALRQELTHRWKHPWAMYYTIILNSIAAAIQGWDQV